MRITANKVVLVIWTGVLILAACLIATRKAPTHDRMLDRVSASIVRITGEKYEFTPRGLAQLTSVCTGFVVQTGVVMTAAHCIDDDLQADGAPAKAIAVDEAYDLALIVTITTKVPLVFRDSEVTRHEVLTAIGYAYGLSQLVIIDVEPLLLKTGPPDAPEKGPLGLLVRPAYIGGQSGGPVVDSDGRVVSIIQKADNRVGWGVPALLLRAFLSGAVR